MGMLNVALVCRVRLISNERGNVMNLFTTTLLTFISCNLFRVAVTLTLKHLVAALGTNRTVKMFAQ